MVILQQQNHLKEVLLIQEKQQMGLPQEVEIPIEQYILDLHKEVHRIQKRQVIMVHRADHQLQKDLVLNQQDHLYIQDQIAIILLVQKDHQVDQVTQAQDQAIQAQDHQEVVKVIVHGEAVTAHPEAMIVVHPEEVVVQAIAHHLVEEEAAMEVDHHQEDHQVVAQVEEAKEVVASNI
jgi:hypothetical protein